MIIIIILFALFINIVGAYSNYNIVQAHSQTDHGIQSLGHAIINNLGENIQKLSEEMKVGLALISAPTQNKIIFSEKFEGPVNIIENQTSPIINGSPTIIDAHLKIETVITGLHFPTSMAFLGPDDILVLEKNKGTVRRIQNGNLLPDPLLDVNVSTLNDRGMLGIALAKDKDAKRNVFVYFTQTFRQDGSDIIQNVTNKNYTYQSKELLGNRLYKYKLVAGTLISPMLLINIPAEIIGKNNIGIHNGGKVIIGPDENVYLIVGDIGGFKTKTQNVLNKIPLNATSVILRISQEGKATGNILGNRDPINKFYAYGIRNSFGMDFDPVTGNLWDTENGPKSNDEINLVKPGFNSGWSDIMGMSQEGSNLDIVNFGGKGKYSDPEFVWNHTVAPTALKFLNSSKLGEQYKNDMFVGDFNTGNLYHFDLNKKRTKLDLTGPLEGGIANSSRELQNVIFGKGFGSISDIQVGPEGFLYIISLYDDAGHRTYPYNENVGGTIFRIRPVFADVN